MIDLTRYVTDVFDRPAVSDPVLRSFANDHLLRLRQLDTDDTFATLIASTSTAYSAFYGQMTTEATEEAIGEGRTITTRQTRAALLKKLNLQQHLVSYSFGKKSDVYQLFFPQGMKEYRRARLDVLPTLLTRYVTAANSHLPQAEAEQVEALASAYAIARSAQLNTISKVDSLRTGRRELRKALTLQLCRNVLIIASHFIENSDAFDDFFDLNLLPKQRKGRLPKKPSAAPNGQ